MSRICTLFLVLSIPALAARAAAPAPQVGTLPRRALLINPHHYLYFNPVPSNLGKIAKNLSAAPFRIPENQISVLCDVAPGADKDRYFQYRPAPPEKSALEDAIREFLRTAQPDESLVLLFAGHALEIGKESFLIPLDGDGDDKKTLLPITWLYDQLSRCKARQKLLILDVLRFPTGRGFELPAPEALGESLEQLLDDPPAGVQVWQACSKGQRSIEIGNTSAFLLALTTPEKDISGVPPTIPVASLLPRVNQRLRELVEPLSSTEARSEQTSHLAGNDKAPPRSSALADTIFAELERIPPIRPGLQSPSAILSAVTSVNFARKTLELYGHEGFNPLDPKMTADEAAKNRDRYPLRFAIFEMVKKMEESLRVSMQDYLAVPASGQLDAKTKMAVFGDQAKWARAIFEMDDALEALQELNKERHKEPSKRWLAHFDFVLGRFQARMVELHEYNYLLANIRTDSLPELGPMQTGWRVISRAKVSNFERKPRDLARELKSHWRKMIEDYPNTPWSVLAQRESRVSLGMAWRPVRETEEK